MPTNLKGSIISHINGYRTKASNAKGHEITNSISHNSNFVIISPKNINKHKKKCQNKQISSILNFIKLSSIIIIVKEKEKKHLTKNIKKIKNESTDSQETAVQPELEAELLFNRWLLKISDLCPEAIEKIKESCK